ncbi:MAG TPA: hypothetical protein VFY87_22745 [Geminicoccaceae bacterium]|nr:hypothetical protein [Geminicoccaceae bacterium]
MDAPDPPPRAAVEHVFAVQKRRSGLVARTVGLARARAKVGRPADLGHDLTRFVRREAKDVPAQRSCPPTRLGRGRRGLPLLA